MVTSERNPCACSGQAADSASRDWAPRALLSFGFGLSQATAYRYLDEVIAVLAAKASGLREALECALAEGTPYVILDGKIVDADRCHEKTVSRKGAEIDPWYSGKRKDLAAARESVLAVIRPFVEKMPVLADSGYESAGHGVLIPVKKPAGVKELDISARTRNALTRSTRCLGERGLALLTQRGRPSSTSP